MAKFIDFEVSVEEQNEKDKEDKVSDDDWVHLKFFIDDNEVENDRTFYQQFENVSNSIDDILKEEYGKSMRDIEKLESSNLSETSEEEGEIDDFKDTEKRIEEFKETLFPVPRSKNDICKSFVNAIFCTVRFKNEQKLNFVAQKCLKNQ